MDPWGPRLTLSLLRENGLEEWIGAERETLDLIVGELSLFPFPYCLTIVTQYTHTHTHTPLSAWLLSPIPKIN